MFIGKALDNTRVLDPLAQTINRRTLLGAPQYKEEAEKVGVSLGLHAGNRNATLKQEVGA
jgi:hypothetical protein